MTETKKITVILNDIANCTLRQTLGYYGVVILRSSPSGSNNIDCKRHSFRLGFSRQILRPRQRRFFRGFERGRAERTYATKIINRFYCFFFQRDVVTIRNCLTVRLIEFMVWATLIVVRIFCTAMPTYDSRIQRMLIAEIEAGVLFLSTCLYVMVCCR